MAVTEFKLTFHGTSLGYLWSLARPLLMFGVLLAVFTQVFRFGDAVPDYPALLLLNIMLFALFSEATVRAVTSVRRARADRPQGPVPAARDPAGRGPDRAPRPRSQPDRRSSSSSLAYGVDPRWTWLLLPVVVLALLIITVAVSMLVSALYPRFRDVA